MIRPHYGTAEIDQHMRGQAWHIESFGNERNEADATRRHVTTAWTVYIDEGQDHIYEVAQWCGGCVGTTSIVQLRCDGSFTCSCPAGKRNFARSKRGFCNHINRLTLHALRRLPTLPAPAGELAALAFARRKAAPRPSPVQPPLCSGKGGGQSDCSSSQRPQLLCTAPTVSVMWMP
jgi:hypothetical protein